MIELFYELSIEADLDLEQIYEYTLVSFGFDHAVNYIISFEDTFEKLLKDPFLGRQRPEIRPDLRSIVNEHDVVFYRVLKDCIRIVRILSSKRDLPNQYLN